MAVVKMKKAYLIAHNATRQKIIDALHEQGLLHVTNLRERTQEIEEKEALAEFESHLKELNLLIDRVEYVLDFLKSFEGREKGFLQSMMKEKVRVDKLKFNTIEDKVKFDDIYKMCKKLDSELTRIENRLSFLQTLRESLKPWEPLKLKFSEIAETKFTKLILGQVATERLEAFKLGLEESIPESHIDTVSRDIQTFYALLTFHKERIDEVQRLLYKYGFHLVSFPGLKDTPKKEITKIEKEYSKLEKDKAKVIS